MKNVLFSWDFYGKVAGVIFILSILSIFVIPLFLKPDRPPVYLLAIDTVALNKIITVADERSIPALKSYYIGTFVHASQEAKNNFVVDTISLAHGTEVKLAGFQDADSTVVVIQLYSALLKQYSREVYTLRQLVQPKE